MKLKAQMLTLVGICAFLMSSCGEPQTDSSLKHFDAKAPTFYVDGNIEYFYDSINNKYYDKDHNEIAHNKIKIRNEIIDFLDRKDAIKSFGKKIEITYKVDEINTAISNAETIISKIESGKYYSAVDANDVITEVNRLIDFTMRQYDYAYILADASAKSEDYDLKNEIYNSYYKLKDEYYAVYVAIAKEGRYNDKFFPGWSQEKIDKYISDHEKKGGGGSSEQTTEQKIENLLNKYRAGKIERYEAYHDYISLAKQLASEKSCANYLDYSYKQYGREYTVSDAKTLSSYVAKYVLPLAQTFRNKLSEAEKNPVILESNKTYKYNFFGSNIDLLRGYALSLDEVYKNNFESFFVDGNYFFSNIVNPNVTAYTANSQTLGRYIFASKKYQDLMSFTHEFGHYYAGVNFGSVPSLDLSETQSQGNELLLLSYLKNTNKNTNAALGFTYEHIANISNSVLLACAINEFEEYAYTTEFTQESLENKWFEIVDKYGAEISRDKLEYLYQVILNYRGYYISYAVSGIAALEIYAKSLDNYSNAVKSYVSICKKDSDNEKFKKSLENAELFDIFSESAYSLIESIQTKV